MKQFFFNIGLGLIFLLFMGCKSTSVTDKSGINNFEQLTGTWYLQNESNDTLLFARTSKLPMGWGPRIEVSSNGELTDANSQRCGNDESIKSNQGNWKVDKNTLLFETTIPICGKSNRYKITELKKDKLVLIVYS